MNVALAEKCPGLGAIRCGVCGTDNGAEALFCSRCTSPVAVAALGELTEADRALCLKALAEVLAELPAVSGQAGDPAEAELFSAYLSAVWLRPETALIQYAEALGLRTLAADGFLPAGPWMDLGCGDGVHAALAAGYRFDPDFDVFQSLNLAARDIFDHFDAADFSAPIAKRGRTVELGVDIKTTAIARSRALGTFARVEQADVTNLPVAGGQFSVVFSNMIRDLGETLPSALTEVRRVLAPGGVLIASAMTPAYRSSLYFEPAAKAAQQRGQTDLARALLRLDRGRSVFCRQQLSPDDWRSRFAAAGLELVHTLPIVGHHAIRFWDVGLRPFAVPAIAQAAQWRAKGILSDVKPALVAMLAAVLEPLRRSVAEGEPCMHLLVARRA